MTFSGQSQRGSDREQIEPNYLKFRLRNESWQIWFFTLTLVGPFCRTSIPIDIHKENDLCRSDNYCGYLSIGGWSLSLFFCLCCENDVLNFVF